jgi:hypothetical protein
VNEAPQQADGDRDQIRRDLEEQDRLDRQKNVTDDEKARIEKDLAEQAKKDPTENE